MLISIVIPVLNARDTIQRTLDSLKVQSFTTFEVIVVDGGSSDGTIARLENEQDRRIRIVSQVGSSITQAVNYGIELARGDAVMPWLCADDFLHRDFLKSAAQCFTDSAVDFTYGNWHSLLGDRIIKSRAPEVGWERHLSYYMPRIMSNSFIFRSSLLKRLGPLDETVRFANDYEFIRRVITSGGKGQYAKDAWYYFQCGGLSQKRLLACLLEVRTIALRYRSPEILVDYYLGLRFLAVRISYFANRCRSLLAGT